MDSTLPQQKISQSLDIKKSDMLVANERKEKIKKEKEKAEEFIDSYFTKSFIKDYFDSI